MPMPRCNRDTALCRAPWQAPRVSPCSLTPRAAVQRAPLLQGSPPRQAAWCAVVARLQARAPLHRDAGCASRTQAHGLEATRTAWTAWSLWTRYLAASRAHLAAGQDDTFLPGSTALAARARLPSCAVWPPQEACT
jgi:hypothetical protein